MLRFVPAILLLAVLSGCGKRTSQPELYIDGEIEAESRAVHAIDNHAHPVAVTGAGEEDRDYDALPVEGIPDLALPAPFRQGSPYFAQAWHALWGYRPGGANPDPMAELRRLKQEQRDRRGDLYPSWVLNRCGTDVMLANRVIMGRGLPGDRFRWVPFADMLLFPLNNGTLLAQDPDRRVFFGNEDRLLRGYLSEAGLSNPPPSLDDYLTFVTHRLESWRASGAIAIKFELAYLRDLSIGNPPKEAADRVYGEFAASSTAPSLDDYRLLQDFLFRYIAREAGRMEMPVHLHCAIGIGSYYRVSGTNPLNLESVFNDPSLRKTRFVMLHSGFPFTREAAAMILKPNVYVDTSALSYLTYPVEAAAVLRQFLEFAPEKVLYGSDATPWFGEVGWEEAAWIGSQLGREALGIAVTGMMRDGEITRERARQFVHMVLRENARQLYRF